MIPNSLKAGPHTAPQIGQQSRAIINYGQVREVKPPPTTQTMIHGHPVTSSWRYEQPMGQELTALWDMKTPESTIIITKRDDVIGRDGKPIRIRPNIAPVSFTPGLGWVSYTPPQDGRPGIINAEPQKERHMRRQAQVPVHWLLGPYQPRWEQRGKPDVNLLAEEWEWGRQILRKPWLLFHLEEALQPMLGTPARPFRVGWEHYNVGGRLAPLRDEIRLAERGGEQFWAKELQRFHDEAKTEFETMARLIGKGREILKGMKSAPDWEPPAHWAVDELRMAAEWRTGEEPAEDAEKSELISLWRGESSPRSDSPDESWSLADLQAEVLRVTGEATKDRSRKRLLAKLAEAD